MSGLSVVHLPGHTPGSAGFSFVMDERRILITGDAVMTKDFFAAEEGYFNSVDFTTVKETIRYIKNNFDIVVPGHDMMFWV